MAEKDYSPLENEDRGKNKRINEDWKTHHTTGDRYPEEAKGIGETDVKNAHASGDGSYGRNESPLPEKDKDDPDRVNSY